MKIKRYIPLLVIVMILLFIPCANAATYTVNLGTVTNGWTWSIGSVVLTGNNLTHTFSQSIPGSVTIGEYDFGDKPYFYLNFTVPDDGSTWQVAGSAQIISYSLYGDYIQTFSKSVNTTVTTTGTFSGYSLKTATDAANAANITAGQAKSSADLAKTYSELANTAANNAKTSADNAAAGALNVYNAVSNTNGNTITAVRDASGTVLSEARQAKTNAANASNNAWYNGSTYGGSAQSVGNVAGYIAYNQLPAMNQGLSQKIDNLNTTINNFAAVDVSPPIVNLTTVSGARATSGNSIKIVVSVSDNISSIFTYSLDDSTYQPLPADRIVTVSLDGFGSVPINVWVKDEAGNTGTNYIAIRKL